MRASPGARMRRMTGVAVLALFTYSAAYAQNYPARPVRMIVPSTPGGSVDTLTRALAMRLSEKWRQQVVVDNRAGAGGVIAAEITAKSVPDGYTLLMCTISSCATNVSLRKGLPYDPVLPTMLEAGVKAYPGSALCQLPR